MIAVAATSYNWNAFDRRKPNAPHNLRAAIAYLYNNQITFDFATRVARDGGPFGWWTSEGFVPDGDNADGEVIAWASHPVETPILRTLAEKRK